MEPTLFSSDDEIWPLIAVLTWIATRSLKFAEAYASMDPLDADHFLHSARQGGGLPTLSGYGAAFQALADAIKAQKLAGKAIRISWIVSARNEQLPIDQCLAQAEATEIFEPSDFNPQELKNANRGAGYSLVFEDFVFHDGDYVTPRGTGYGSPRSDGSRTRWTWKGITFVRDEVLRLWQELPVFSTWKKAKVQPWKPTHLLSPTALNSLPLTPHVSFAEVVTLLAFGPELLPIGLNATQENAARLSAGLALLRAASQGKVSLFGHPAFRLPHFPGGLLPVGALGKIEPVALVDMVPVIDRLVITTLDGWFLIRLGRG